MRGVKKRILVIALAFAMLALPISAAYATKPVEVSGVIFPGGMPSMEIKEAGKSDNQIMELVGLQAWDGDISGIGSWEARWMMHNADDEENLEVNAKGLVTLSGEVAGMYGTVTIKLSGKSGVGHWRIISGTGELANVHGQGITWMINPEIFLMGYEGVIHFDP